MSTDGNEGICSVDRAVITLGLMIQPSWLSGPTTLQHESWKIFQLTEILQIKQKYYYYKKHVSCWISQASSTFESPKRCCFTDTSMVPGMGKKRARCTERIHPSSPPKSIHNELSIIVIITTTRTTSSQQQQQQSIGHRRIHRGIRRHNWICHRRSLGWRGRGRGPPDPPVGAVAEPGFLDA